MAIEITVPSPGESISEVTISQWLKKKGDYVEMDEPIAEFESDKATFEVNATEAGAIEELVGDEGDTIGVGAVVARIDTSAKAPKKAKVETPKLEDKQETPKAEKKVEKPAEVASAGMSESFDAENISPLAKQLLVEYNLNPSQVVGTGANGRITKMDILEAAAKLGSGSSSSSNYDNPTQSRESRRNKMSNLRKTVGKRLVAAKNQTAMLTTFNEVNMKPIMDLRTQYKQKFAEKHEVGLGFMSFFTRACCIALQDWPAVNAYIDGEEMVFNDFCDISIAVSGPKGLVVPVIRNAESLTFAGIESEVKRLAIKARDNKLSLDEMTGGTFTISNGGVFGSMLSTPIINPPQSGILGMHNIVERPVVENGEVVVRPIMFVALSYDHRVIDGRESVSFLVRVKQLLENPEMMLDGKKPEESLLRL
jgi:2-oxoglutarate dehydrogenase E2 component (dihydrolipoamide succinyltransferase)